MRSIINLIKMGCLFFVFLIMAMVIALGFYLVDLNQRADRCENKGGTYIQVTGDGHKCVDLKEIK